MYRYKNPKFLAKSRKSKQVKMALISMLCSIALSVTCLVGTTWAWFETSYQMGSSTIRIATFAVAVSMEKGDQEIEGQESDHENLVATDQYTYELKEIGIYKVNLVNNGEIPGYCTVQLKTATEETIEYTTGMLYPFGEGATDSATVELEVTPQDSYNGLLPIELKIIPSWGQDPNQEVADIHDSVFVPETTGSTESTEPSNAGQSGEPAATTATDPLTTEPVSTKPDTTEPETSETEATEPVITEIVATEPTVTEPEQKSRTIETEPPATTESPTETTVATE